MCAQISFKMTDSVLQTRQCFAINSATAPFHFSRHLLSINVLLPRDYQTANLDYSPDQKINRQLGQFLSKNVLPRVIRLSSTRPWGKCGVEKLSRPKLQFLENWETSQKCCVINSAVRQIQIWRVFARICTQMQTRLATEHCHRREASHSLWRIE